MFCSKCGCMNNDNAAFCKKCGHAFNPKADQAAAQTNVKSPYQVSQYQQNSQNLYNTQQKTAWPEPDNGEEIRARIFSTVQSACSSPLFLFASIALTVYLLIASVNFVNYLTNVTEYFIVDYIISYVISSVIVFIIIGLFVIGLWITYVSALNKNKHHISTAGLTMAKVTSIIQLVIVCIGIALYLLSLIVIVISLRESATLHYQGDFIYNATILVRDLTGRIRLVSLIELFVMILVTLAAAVLYIIYTVKLIKTINRVKKAIRKYDISRKASMFVVVINFVIAGLLLIGAGMNISNGSGILGVSGIIAMSLFMAFLAASILNYRSKIKLHIQYEELMSVKQTQSEAPQHQQTAPQTQSVYNPPQTDTDSQQTAAAPQTAAQYSIYARPKETASDMEITQSIYMPKSENVSPESEDTFDTELNSTVSDDVGSVSCDAESANIPEEDIAAFEENTDTESN